MQRNPYFSVIIPVYNREKFIARAIESILNQIFTDWELIIVDDASTDNTREILTQFNDLRIRTILNEKNLERCITRNKGIEQATGNYICFLDSDDYHLANHLQRLYDFILSKQEPEAFFFTNAWDESADGTRIERYCPDFEKVEPETYFLRYTVNPQRWAVHKNVIQKHLFDPNINICEDMDVSLRMVAAGTSVYQLPERTTVYVAAPDSFTHGATDKWERELTNLEKIFNRPELKTKLPNREKNRLRSMCQFHLTRKAFDQNQKLNVWKYGIKSFVNFPKGYNGKTNKILITALVYSIPILGNLLSALIKRSKKI